MFNIEDEKKEQEVKLKKKANNVMKETKLKIKTKNEI